MTTNTGGPPTEGRAMSLPELPELFTYYDIAHGMVEVAKVANVEARERIFVAEIERLRAMVARTWPETPDAHYQRGYTDGQITGQTLADAELYAENAELRKEVESLRPDAERYRHLRDAPVESGGLVLEVDYGNGIIGWLKGELADKMIDAARVVK